MDAITIRPFASADVEAVTAIYADAVENGTASYELTAPSRSEMAARLDTLAMGGYLCLVADIEGSVAGYAYAGPFRPRPAYRFIVEDSIYVAPRAKGRGLGSRLLTSLVDQSTSLGFRQMIAVIGDGSPTSASVRLHQKLGFIHSGILRGSGYKHGRWLDTVFMQLEMNGGNGSPPDPQSLPERRFRDGP